MTITSLNPGDEIVDTWIDAVQGAVGGPWSTYTPTIFGSSSNPTQGNSTYSGRYRYLNDHTVVAVVWITIGSTFTAGSGFYQIALPVLAAEVAHGYGATAAFYLLDISGSIEYAGVARIFSGTVVMHLPKQDGTTTSGHAITAGLVGAAFPVVPQTGDEYRFSIMYEV